MRPVLTAAQSREADTYTITNGIPSLVLMERAALSVVQTMREEGLPLERAVVVCGTGNNGGDGIAVARILADYGHAPRVLLAGDPGRCSPDRKTQEEMLRSLYDVPVCTFPDPSAFEDATIVVDAVFGIGLSRPVTGAYAEVIEAMNASGLPVVAVDMPSGIHTDTGEVLGTAVRAAHTVTFTTPKPGQLLYPGRTFTGQLTVTPIGIRPTEACLKEEDLWEVTEDDLSLIPPRDEAGNKGTFGKILVIAGSWKICGAAILAARAALRCGAGMVRIYTEEVNRTPVAASFPEALLDTYQENSWRPDELETALRWADTVLIGPGLSTGRTAEQILSYVLENAGQPLILDADALNLLAGSPERLRGYPSACVITPHVMEMSRLLGDEVRAIKTDPIAAARRAAERTCACVVLKDAATVIADPSGETVLYAGGSSALATAGSGDVLAGILAAMVTHFGGGPSPASALAVCLHGLCGEHAASLRSPSAVIAGDLTESLSAWI